jgi:tetratricopeptide (TPR) repeat protein
LPVEARIGAWCLALTVVGSVLAFGAQHMAPLVVAALLAATSAWLLGSRVVNPPRSVWFFVALSGYTMLQLVPLPLSFVSFLSPHAGALWAEAFIPFGETAPRWVSLSVDPAATALEIVKWSAFPCVLLAALAIRARLGEESLAAFVFLSCVLVAAVSLGHGAFGLTRTYGIFEASFTTERWTSGPLLNGNHLAGYANLGFFSGAGLLLAGRGPLPRWALIAGAFALASCTLLSMSRAGLGLLGLGSVVLGAVALRRGTSRLESALLVGGIFAATLVLLLLVVGDQRVFHELSNQDWRGKVAVWGWSLDLIRDFPIFGTGRGAFETAFQPYRRIQEHDWTLIFSHPENLVVQLVSEWGVPIGAAALIAFGAAVVWPLSRLSRSSRVGIGLRLGLAVLVAQNLFDFSLEVFAVSAAAAVAYAAASPPVHIGEKRQLKVPAVLCCSLAIGVIAVFVLGATPVQIERRSLAAEYRALPSEAKVPPELSQELRRAVGRHPGEAYFPLLAGLIAHRTGQDALPFLARALDRAPVNGNVHVALASILFERGATGQALMHLRLAARYDALLREYALTRVASWGKLSSVVTRAFPKDAPGGELLGQVCHRLAKAERIECWRSVVGRGSGPVTVREQLSTALLEAAESKRPPCEDLGPCQTEVAELMRGQDARLGWLASFLRVRARTLDATPATAVEALLASCPVAPEAAPCAEAALRHAEKAASLDLVQRAAERFTLSVCPGASCAAAHERAGGIFAAAGAKGHALEQFNLAAKEDPSPARWLSVARAALAAGARSSALVALDRALTGDVTDEQRAEAASLRERLTAARP